MHSISGNVARLRKAKGMTQEKLAGLVGVSTSAVSKWESGASLPDIALLMPLARALDTDLNALLSFDKELSQDMLQRISAELDQLFVSSPYETAREAATRYIHEYPHAHELKLSIAGKYLLFAAYDGERDEEKLRRRIGNAISLLQNPHPAIREQALYIQAQAHMMLEDYALAEAILKQMPPQPMDTSVLYLSVLQKQNKGEELVAYSRLWLFDTLNKACFLLDMLGRALQESDQAQALRCYELSFQLHELFKHGIDYASRAMAMLYLNQGNLAQSAAWFHTFIQRLIAFPYDFSEHPLFKGLKLKLDATMQRDARGKLVQAMLADEGIPALAQEAAYTSALKLMADYLQQNK